VFNNEYSVSPLRSASSHWAYFALGKVFNTEIGFLVVPKNSKFDPRWVGMGIAIVLCGIGDFYLNLRAARLMKLQAFVPVAFAWCTTLQYFQSVALFNELRGLKSLHVALSLGGACVSLVGALLIMCPNLLPSRSLLVKPEVEEIRSICDQAESRRKGSGISLPFIDDDLEDN